MKITSLGLSAIILSLALVFSSISTTVVHAATSSIFLQAPSAEIIKGSRFTVTVKGSSDVSGYVRSTTSGTLSYPVSIVKVVSTSTTGSAYANMRVSVDAVNGAIGFTGSVNPVAPGQKTVFSVTFEGVGPGVATPSFSTDTVVDSSIFYPSVPTKTGGRYTVKNPVVIPPPTPTPPPKPTPPPAPTPTQPPPKPTPPPAPTQPAVDIAPAEPTVGSSDPSTTPSNEDTFTPVQIDSGGLKISDVSSKLTTKLNSISWRSSFDDSTSEFSYGESRSSQKRTAVVDRAPDGTFTVTLKKLKLGTQYFYTIKVKSGEKVASYEGTITTRGYPTRIAVLDAEAPVAGASFKLGGRTYRTDIKGSVLLELSNQSYTAVITTKNKKVKEVSFTVKSTVATANGAYEQQAITLDISDKPAEISKSAAPILPIIAAAAGVIVLGAGGFGLLLYRRRKSDQMINPSDTISYTSFDERQSQAPVPNLDYLADQPTIPGDSEYAPPVAYTEEQLAHAHVTVESTIYEDAATLAAPVEPYLYQPNAVIPEQPAYTAPVSLEPYTPTVQKSPPQYHAAREQDDANALVIPHTTQQTTPAAPNEQVYYPNEAATDRYSSPLDHPATPSPAATAYTTEVVYDEPMDMYEIARQKELSVPHNDPPPVVQ